jgi:transposase
MNNESAGKKKSVCVSKADMLKNGENYNTEFYRSSALPSVDREITIEQAILIPRNQGYKIKPATA